MSRRNDEHRAGSESDESSELTDNSLGRLLTLSDGVFAIAMTLLTLDLKVPDLGAHPSDAALRHALGHNASAYLSFLVSFFVVANYWNRHRHLMRSVVRSHGRLIQHTIVLLVIVAVMPFLASLLGEYGGTPFALALYGAFNAAATLVLMLIARDVRQYDLLDKNAELAGPRWEARLNLLVFLLCVPGGYLLGHNGPWLLVLLALPGPAGLLQRARQRHRDRHTPEHAM